MKFKNAITRYINSRSSRLARNTLRTYTCNLKKLEEWVGKLELEQVTDEHVEKFLVQLKDRYSEKTRENYANSLRAFFKYWSAKRKSPVAWELIQGPRVPETFRKFISREQFDLIDDCLDEDEFYELTKKVIFHLLWNTGMRISELLSLNLEDVHVQKNHAYITTLKTKKLRMVMWNDECHRLLVRYLGVRINLNNRTELFQTPMTTRNQKRRTRLTPRTVQRWCGELEEFLGFRIHPHAFRHGACHRIISEGGNRHHVQTIAGHSSITSSEIYTRLNLQEQTQLLEKFLPKNPEQPRKNQPMIDKAFRFAA
ncbi:MAG: tyrosine-type recombinase/integrase [Flavobacteriales bacterium]|nr:tyrosine-type recombinase/integrase [Flavobacteriales bacterium]